jgi:hypothetical protein
MSDTLIWIVALAATVLTFLVACCIVWAFVQEMSDD